MNEYISSDEHWLSTSLNNMDIIHLATIWLLVISDYMSKF